MTASTATVRRPADSPYPTTPASLDTTSTPNRPNTIYIANIATAALPTRTGIDRSAPDAWRQASVARSMVVLGGWDISKTSQVPDNPRSFRLRMELPDASGRPSGLGCAEGL